MRLMITEKNKLIIVKSEENENMSIKYNQETATIEIDAESLELDILDITALKDNDIHF